MGIQSLQEGVLDQVKRGHGEHLALDTCRQIIDAGLILNIDLIYGLPGQSHEDFARDFQLVAEAGVQAVTAYNLRLNERTSVQNSLQSHERFDLQRLMDWREVVRETAAHYGYTQTRWHTFKRVDSVAARHERLPVADRQLKGYQLGVGMSARSSIGHTLYRNHSKLATYLERVESGLSPVEEYIPLGPDDLKTQFIARTLGDGKGLDSGEYAQVFSSDIRGDFRTVMDDLAGAGLIEDDGAYIAMTATGRLLYDLVMLSFYPEHAKDWLKSQLEDYQLLNLNS
jgi:oxygen-independent coproporphyrinogen-3 oxidase